MVGNVRPANTATTVHALEVTDRIGAIYDRVPAAPGQIRRARKESLLAGSSNPDPQSTTDPLQLPDAEAIRQQKRTRSDDYIERGDRSATRQDSVCERQASYAAATTTWLSQVRRRCSNIRDWLPKMCSCLEGGPPFLGQSVGNYQRLEANATSFEFARRINRTRVRFVGRTDDVLVDDQDRGTGQVTPFVRLSDYALYRIPSGTRSFRAPFPWGICLRPSRSIEAESTGPGESGLKVIAFPSEKSRAYWLTAMRLAKYGKQLRENYRAFKNKQCEQSDNPKDRYVNYNVSNESVRSRVAMDFTGSVGRIVEDPKEAKNIAESEGVNWRRTWRPFSRPPPGCAVVRLHGLDDGIHVLQPWFHRGLKRDIAAAIVRDHGSVDGVFLVRESKSNLGAYVLTYKYSDKVFHAQIQPVFDERCNCWLYTLDKGITRFYDLLQLIEFYQLNAGCLPTRLTRYVQSGGSSSSSSSSSSSASSSSSSSSAAGDGATSPSPSELLAPSAVSVAYPAAGHRSI